MQRTEAAWETDSDQFHSFPSSPEFTVQKTVVLKSSESGFPEWQPEDMILRP